LSPLFYSVLFSFGNFGCFLWLSNQLSIYSTGLDMPQTCGMLPLPSNVLEQFSAKGFGLITGRFPWIKPGGDLRADSRNDSLSNLCFCDMVSESASV